MQVLPPDLKEAVELQHGGKASFVQSLAVSDSFGDQAEWDGLVAVFALAGHPKATRAYAWMRELPDGKVRTYAVLHIPPVTSAFDAVRAAIVAEAKRQQIGLSDKALRKLRRKAESQANAKIERFWKKEGSALQLGYNKPVDRQAAKDLSHRRSKKR